LGPPMGRISLGALRGGVKTLLRVKGGVPRGPLNNDCPPNGYVGGGRYHRANGDLSAVEVKIEGTMQGLRKGKAFLKR